MCRLSTQSGAHSLLHAAYVLQAVFNDVKGDECIFLWRAIGAALVSLVAVSSYSLKVGFHLALLTVPAHCDLPPTLVGTAQDGCVCMK